MKRTQLKLYPNAGIIENRWNATGHLKALLENSRPITSNIANGQSQTGKGTQLQFWDLMEKLYSVIYETFSINSAIVFYPLKLDCKVVTFQYQLKVALVFFFQVLKSTFLESSLFFQRQFRAKTSSLRKKKIP